MVLWNFLYSIVILLWNREITYSDFLIEAKLDLNRDCMCVGIRILRIEK